MSNMNEAAGVVVDFYLDFISPFGYLANRRLEELVAGRPGVSLRYHPVSLPRIKLAAGNNGPTNREIPPKIRYLTTDLRRWAERYDVPMVDILPGPATAAVNKGLFMAIDRQVAPTYVHAAWHLIWGVGQDPGTQAYRSRLAVEMGWPEEEFTDFVQSNAAETRYEAENVAAIEKGVFGVPTMMIGEDMWWGNDRIDFLEQYIDTYTDA